MIQITVQTRILVAIQAVDFRKGIDGLARVCQEQLQADPFSGRLFVFRNRRRTALKILAYDLCSVFSNVKLVVRNASLRGPARKILHINR